MLAIQRRPHPFHFIITHAPRHHVEAVHHPESHVPEAAVVVLAEGRVPDAGRPEGDHVQPALGGQEREAAVQLVGHERGQRALYQLGFGTM